MEAGNLDVRFWMGLSAVELVALIVLLVVTIKQAYDLVELRRSSRLRDG